MLDGAVLPWENLLVEGENVAAMIVSSELVVDVECLTALGCCRGDRGVGEAGADPASNLATALATMPRLDTRPLFSNAYPGLWRGGSIVDDELGKGDLE